MSRSSALILLGILIVLAPLSGLPQSWVTFLLAIFGIIVALIGVALRSQLARQARDAAYVPPSLPTAESSPAEPAAEHHGPSSIA